MLPEGKSNSCNCGGYMLIVLIVRYQTQYATGSHLHPIGYLAWAQGEPLPIAWLPILHRMTAAETSKCIVRKMFPTY